MTGEIPAEIAEIFIRTDGEPLQQPDLSSVLRGDIVKALTISSVWIIEVDGHDEEGCVTGKLTRTSEQPMFDPWRRPSDLQLVRQPGVIGGFADVTPGALAIQTQIPGRPIPANIETAEITALSVFRQAEQEQS